MSFILDCTTGKHALSSLSSGFECNVSELQAALLSLDIEAAYEDSRIIVPPETYLYQYIVAELGTHVALSGAVWFHCTRTHPSELFVDGILPLNSSVDRVWEMVLSLAPDDKVRQRLNDWGPQHVPDKMYQLRTKNPMHWGPYGILVREVAFHTEDLGQHDYLGMPELVEDICNAYRENFGEDIFKHYNDALIPKVVTFVSDKNCYDGCIQAALGYAYTTVRGLPPNYLAVMCIDCDGEEVSPSQIVRVEAL